jgi:hypothetical protein
MNESDVPEVAELIKAILSKLEANKDVLRRSIDGGAIEWDWTTNRVFKVRLKPRL